METDQVRLPGRVLFLSEDPVAVQRQLHGENLTLGAALPLRDGVSVDEITPSWVCYYFGERLQDFPYLGFLCGGQFPFTEGSVARGRFQVAVSGEQHGRHGPREAALFAEYSAGIRLVVARSFDPSYLQHCHSLGLLTSTVFHGPDAMRYAGMTMCSVFLVGLCALPFAPETKGQPLPE